MAALALSLAILMPAPSSAYDFRPTEAEWRTWPEYCRAKYVKTNVGGRSDYSTTISDGDVARWEGIMGESWFALHHFCAGLAMVDRAGRMPSKQARDTQYNRASTEFVFFIERTPSTHNMYAEAVVRTCLAKDRVAVLQEALTYCDLAITSQPTNPVGYVGKATVYRRNNDLVQAREVLEQGHEETGGKSAELEYYLGLTYVDLKDYARAVERAKVAYSLGYPLPGLRDRLKAAGHSLQ